MTVAVALLLLSTTRAIETSDKSTLNLKTETETKAEVDPQQGSVPDQAQELPASSASTNLLTPPMRQYSDDDDSDSEEYSFGRGSSSFFNRDGTVKDQDDADY